MNQKGFPSGSVVKNLPALHEMHIPVLGGENPLQEEMATHSSILAGKILWTEEYHGQRSAMGYSPWSHKESVSTHSLTHSLNKNIWRKKTHTHTKNTIWTNNSKKGTWARRPQAKSRGDTWHGSWISDTKGPERGLESKPRARMQSPENWAEILVSCWPDSHTGYTQSLLSCREAVWKNSRNETNSSEKESLDSTTYLYDLSEDSCPHPRKA